MPTANNHLQQEIVSTDDSDPDTDTGDLEDSYRPISFQSDSDSDSEPQPQFQILSDDGGNLNLNPNPNPNPNSFSLHTENGISSIDLNGGLNQEQEVESESEEEVESAREREASILRAFEEDESRRTAPITPENATRIVDAMRGVNFLGSAPDWMGQVPEDRWIDRLHNLRGDSDSNNV